MNPKERIDRLPLTMTLLLRLLLASSCTILLPSHIEAFQVSIPLVQHPSYRQQQRPRWATTSPTATGSTTTAASAPPTSPLYNQLVPVPRDLDDVPIPFVDRETMSFIECFADCTCTHEEDGIEYTIGVPCDNAVALCYEQNGELVPIDNDMDRMNDVYPVAESIVAEEFGDELSLQRTPQTLTLVGELDEDFDDEDDEEEEEENDEESDDEKDMDEETEEAVEVLLSFEHRDLDYHLVRLLDPVLIVGREGPEDEESGMQRRFLLTLEESKKVMPTLEKLFLEYNEELSGIGNDDELDEFADIDDFSVVE